MSKTHESTYNLKKHSNNNPLSKVWLNNFNNSLLSYLQRINPKTILDVGCGEGFTLEFLKKNRVGDSLEGIDSLDEAIDLGKKLHTDLKLKKGDIYKLDYKNNSFDVVICTEVLEHLTNPSEALFELKRVTRKYLLLSVPNEPWFTFQRIARGINLFQLGAHPEHINHWSYNGFEKFVKNHELKILAKKSPLLAWTLILAEK